MPIVRNANLLTVGGIRLRPHEEITPGMVLIEGVILSVSTDKQDVPITNDRPLYMTTRTAIVPSEPDSLVAILGTIDPDMLEAINEAIEEAGE